MACDLRIAWRPLLAMLALIAVAARGLVPQGYMLAAARDGHLLEVTICTGTLAERGAIDLRTGKIVSASHAPEKPTHEKQGAGLPCVFASLSPLAAPHAGPALRVDAPRRVLAAAPAEARAVIFDPTASLPPSTGPPASA